MAGPDSDDFDRRLHEAEQAAAEAEDEKENERKLHHLGALGLLAQVSVQLAHRPEAEELRELIMECLSDGQKFFGYRIKRTLHRIELETLP